MQTDPSMQTYLSMQTNLSRVHRTLEDMANKGVHSKMQTKLSPKQQMLEEMLNEAHHSDVTFETEINDRTPAHRCVLATISPVFRAMFSTAMIEETTKTVRIDDMTSSGFRAFLRLLYIGWLDRDDIQAYGRELLAASHKYQTPEATKLVSAVLCKTITVDNCVTMFEHGSLYDETLFSCCKTFMGKNWQRAVNTPEFADLTMRKPGLQLDLVRSIALKDQPNDLKELRASFRGCTTVMKMDPSSTISVLVRDLRVQIHQPTMCLQIVGVVDHRIDRIYNDCETIGDLPIWLKAEEIRPKTELIVRVSHMLTDSNGMFSKYFGEPFTIRTTIRPATWYNLNSRLSPLLTGLSSSHFQFARRRSDAPYDSRVEYLHGSFFDYAPVLENEFLAIIHPTCKCCTLDRHSPLDHSSRDVVF